MATVKSLEDMLSSEVDESAVTALVGSLESQLASSNIQLSSQDVNTTSVTVNHVNNAVLVDNNVTRLLDGQKQGVIAASQAVSLINVGKPAIVTSPIGDVNATSTVTSNASNVIATLPGALPASGYITQVTGPSQQSFFSPIVSGSIAVNRATNSQEIKVVSQAVVSQINSTCTINTRSKTAAAAAAAMPNGSPNNVGLLTVRPNQTTSMGAIYDLANVASQQSPIVTSNTCVTTTTPTSSQVQVTVANGKQITAIKSQADSKSSIEKNGKSLVIARTQENLSVPNTVVQTTVMHQIAGTNVIQVSNPAVVSKSHVTTSQPVSVASQVVTPNILSPGVQIVNMNPRLGVQGLTGQKTLAPRVVLATNPVRIAPQIIARAGVAGQRGLSQNNAQIKVQTYQQQRVAAPKNQIVGQKVIPCSTNKGTITLAPGMVRGAVLLKAENGQLQVVNIAGSSASTIPGGATYRLQSIPPGATSVRTVTPQQLVSVPVSATGLKANQVSVTVPQSIVGTIIQPGTTQLNDANSRLSSPNATKSGVIKAGINGNLTTPLTVQTTTANSQPGTPTQMSPNTAKKKCKNFLSTLIRLADEQPAAVARSVRNLIQGIIDGTMQAEEFTTKLQKELNSAPQPYLVPFLKKNLPYLRHSLITKELTIEGVRPPPPGAVILPHPSSLQQIQIGQKRPVMQPTTQVRLMAGQTAPLAAQLLQQNQNIINQRFSVPRLPSTTQAKSLLVGKTLVASSVAASSPATVTALQSKFQGKIPVLNSSKDPSKRTFSALRDDDDINDVAAMGGVNLVEESQKILASNSEIVGTQIRSCKDESFLFSSALQRRIHEIAQKHGLDDVSPDVINLVSHASQIRLKNLVEKLSVIAEHRVETPKNDSRYEITQDVKSQIKFLEELDRLEKRRHEEQEREILLRAAKSRSKLEDPEQLKLKQKAKEMQRAELEELRQREANTTALLAIGPRKKAKLENNSSISNQTSPGSYPGSSNNPSKFQARPRVKRVNIRDLLYLMEQERDTVRRPLLYKSYLK
ncbi:transcription initiation factor TFIID subunit 4-like isoform X2 [Argiope bruennichi]|uniref:Transcription initiation factor TFIID subunit 4 like protein n=1 Tax=Argiope bruennichi TaxID=94029 RepID=A0A8T0EU03_ARGBR|nr:transcription initiation factor TFIID subunit 4-like isoform X2 [Argiope bruennichi]KAF8781796.1 Transcription initiation factor TFIID subunit 4 like protein [Argiope bruennichi]